MTELPRLSVSLVALGLAGCFGSSTTASPDAGSPSDDSAPDDGAAPGAEAAAPAGDAAPAADAAPPTPPVADADASANPGAGIYVSQAGNQVLVFALGATGNAAPIRTIAGTNTGLALPIGVALDASGNLYVANRLGTGVTVYAPGVSGDVAPIRTLSAAGLQAAEGVVVGKNGDVFVSACPSCGSSGGGQVAVYHFPAGSSQSDSSIAGADTGLTNPSSLAFDADQNLVVGNSFGGVVATFAPGATGDAMPIRSFTPTPAANLQAIAFADQTIFVAVPSGILSLFPAAATGTSTASATFSSLGVQYPAGVAVDVTAAQPVVYVVDTSGGVIDVVQTTGSAPMLAPGTVTTIQGAATGLQSPLGIVIVR